MNADVVVPLDEGEGPQVWIFKHLRRLGRFALLEADGVMRQRTRVVGWNNTERCLVELKWWEQRRSANGV